MRRTVSSLAAVCVLCVACGQAAVQTHAHKPPRKQIGAVASTPAGLLAQILANLNTKTIQAAGLSSAPAGDAQGTWLYVQVTHSSGAAGVLPDFNALLLAGAYSVAAPDNALQPPDGLAYFDPSTSGCTPPDTSGCDAASWHINPAPVPYTPTNADAATLTTRIRNGLDKAGLDAVSIDFEKPLNHLVPIVVARTTAPASTFEEQWQAIREQVLGLDTGYEGDYLELVDQTGQPIAITAVDADLGVAISWKG